MDAPTRLTGSSSPAGRAGGARPAKDPGSAADDSPFHEGERRVQVRLGVRERVERVGRRFMTDRLPETHQDLYARLPYLLVGSLNRESRPWASMLAGRPGFVHSPDPRTLVVRGGVVAGDPLEEGLRPGAPVGVLGIELHTRQRVRLAGRVREAGDPFTVIDVTQAFGNCPKYIQAREHTLLAGIDRVGEPRPQSSLGELDATSRDIIGRADGFFIATAHPEPGSAPCAGLDISHRGGRPGFVRVDDARTLTWPEFRGNSFYNTLGNLVLNPAAGLLFPDFGDGSLLYLTGRTEILWDAARIAGFEGAERFVRFRVEAGRIVHRAVPIQWRLLGYSRSLERVGAWGAARGRIPPP